MSETATSTSSFVSSIGVNVHLSDNQSAYGNLPLVTQELQYIGVDQIRDNEPYSWSLSAYETLAAEGIKEDLIIGYNPDEQMSTADLQSDLSLIDQIEKATPGSIIGVEALNEPYNFPNYWNGVLTNNWTVVQQVQQAEYNLVKSDPNLAGVPFLSTSTDPNSFANSTAPNLSAIADIGNAHVYPYDGAPALSVMNNILSGQQQIVPGKPDWITEFGYGTAPQDQTYGCDQATQAKNILNGLFDAYKEGVQKTFIYQLNDFISGSSSGWDEQGLFNPDGTAKTAAVALHNLTSILSDTASNAATFTPGQIGYTIANLPSTGNSLLMQKASGVYELALWNDAVDWNPSTESEVTVQPTATTINLGTTYASIEVFDPMAGTTPIATYSNVSSVTVGLTDHPLIVQLSGASGTTTGVTVGATPSANDTVVLAGSTAAITDASGNHWTITSGGQVAVNGVADTVTSNVIKLAYVNGLIWQENASDLWWSKTSPSASWSAGGGSPYSPLPSANDTVVLAGSTAAITDASGNHWTITSGGQVAVNGVADTVTSNVIELAYVNGLIWQENASDLWWSKASPSASWSAGGGVAVNPMASANDTVAIVKTNSTITDASGNHWTITSGGQVAVNGVADTITSNVKAIAYVNNVVWQENGNALWWSKTSPTAAWSAGGGTSTSPLPATDTIVALSGISVNVASGNNAVFVTTSGNTITFGTGNNTITDSASGNRYVIPKAGSGMETFTNDFLTGTDMLDLRPALAATNWNGTASTLSNYLSVSDSTAGAVLSIAPTSGGKGVGIVNIHGASTATLTTLLAHALT